jgi:hypothetical protein
MFVNKTYKSCSVAIVSAFPGALKILSEFAVPISVFTVEYVNASATIIGDALFLVLMNQALILYGSIVYDVLKYICPLNST